MNRQQILQRTLPKADEHYVRCELCEHRCKANRIAGERGPCKADATPRVFRHRIEVGEESELIPSHLFYLSGCDLRCAFCIAEANAFDPHRGQSLTSSFFAEAVKWGRQRGARNVQWVGGEPTIHLPAILRVMADADDLPPIVWKSDFFGSPEAFDLLRDVVDVFVADFKFGNDDCARRIAGVERYCEIVTRNLCIVAEQADLIVRHLLLPGHEQCCFVPILEWVQQHLPAVKLSVRDGYLPKWQASRHTDLNRVLAPDEGRRALSLARSMGLNVIV